jgi:hypothetical protein
MMWLLDLVDDSDEVQFLSFVRDGDWCVVLYCIGLLLELGFSIGLLLVMYVRSKRFGRKK